MFLPCLPGQRAATAHRPYILYLGKNIILSCTGVQEGDPLGTLGFALPLYPIIMLIKEEVPNFKVNAWYLDDSTLCGSPSDLVRALEIIEEMSAQRDLSLNRAKSFLYIPPDADTFENTLLKEIPICRKGFTLLGCPIGPPKYCNDVLTSATTPFLTIHDYDRFNVVLKFLYE